MTEIAKNDGLRFIRTTIKQGLTVIISTLFLHDLDAVTSSSDEHQEAVNIDTWIKRSDVIRHFPCSEITTSGQTFSRFVVLLFIFLV